MGKTLERIDEKLQEFISKQAMFFVATAPLGQDGHINVSPKGLDSFRIIDDNTVIYVDLAGSGIETVAHLQENGRIVVMFCAFEGAPKIVRLHGHGTVIDREHPDFEHWRSEFKSLEGVRSFIKIHCDRISDSCGFGVPLYELKGQRTQLTAWADCKGEEGVTAYIQEKNQQSIDGLPGLVTESNEASTDVTEVEEDIPATD